MKQALFYFSIGLSISMMIGITMQFNKALMNIETTRRALIKMGVVK